jgi:hypothetical protein
MLSKAYRGEVMIKSSVSEWHKRFKMGHNSVEDDERSGHPRSHRTNENVKKAWNLMHSDRYLSNRAVQLNLEKQIERKA